jgi:endogenous inhibitor of DNA gyrase (YacG/DUF329 family)
VSNKKCPICKETIKMSHMTFGTTLEFCSDKCLNTYLNTKIQLNNVEGLSIIDSNDEGIKSDDGKQSWYYMPLEVLEPLADTFKIGVEVKGYPPFNCLKPFKDGNRRLYEATLRHTKASQINPLATNSDDGDVYHLAQVAFSALIRLYHARKDAGLI